MKIIAKKNYPCNQSIAYTFDTEYGDTIECYNVNHQNTGRDAGFCIRIGQKNPAYEEFKRNYGGVNYITNLSWDHVTIIGNDGTVLADKSLSKEKDGAEAIYDMLVKGTDEVKNLIKNGVLSFKFGCSINYDTVRTITRVGKFLLGRMGGPNHEMYALVVDTSSYIFNELKAGRL